MTSVYCPTVVTAMKALSGLLQLMLRDATRFPRGLGTRVFIVEKLFIAATAPPASGVFGDDDSVPVAVAGLIEEEVKDEAVETVDCRFCCGEEALTTEVFVDVRSKILDRLLLRIVVARVVVVSVVVGGV